MGDPVCFSRNRCTSVEQLDERTLRSCCRLQDSLLDAFVEIRVKLPDLEVTAARGEVCRSDREACFRGPVALDRIVGIRIGPGMGKIIKGLLGEDEPVKQLGFMVKECCHGVILAFTKETLRDVPEDLEAARKFFRGMVRENIRLYDRCAAYARGSTLVEGVDAEKREKGGEESRASVHAK